MQARTRRIGVPAVSQELAAFREADRKQVGFSEAPLETFLRSRESHLTDTYDDSSGGSSRRIEPNRRVGSHSVRLYLCGHSHIICVALFWISRPTRDSKLSVTSASRSDCR